MSCEYKSRIKWKLLLHIISLPFPRMEIGNIEEMSQTVHFLYRYYFRGFYAQLILLFELESIFASDIKLSENEELVSKIMMAAKS